jgi:hypothetical protein
MQPVLQFFAFIIAMAVLGLLLFLAFKFFLVLLLVGLCLAALAWLRRFLVAKEILNPKPGAPPDITVIEVDYERVDENEKKKD